MADPAPEVITQYFDAQSKRDFNALVKLFVDDGVVIDEGKTWIGATGIRAWRDKAASAYQYTTEVLNVKPIGKSQFVARVHLEGNFPGRTVDLDYKFTVEGARIRRLEVA
jgi:uncharacterized protein (TIGR02246 family)